MILSDMLFFIIAPAISFALAVAYRGLTTDISDLAIHRKLRGASLFFPCLVFVGILLLYLTIDFTLVFRLAQIIIALIFAVQLLMLPFAMLSKTARQKTIDIMPSHTRNVAISFAVLIGKITYITAAHTLKLVVRFLRAGFAKGRKHNKAEENSPFGHHGHLSSSEQSKKDMGLPY
ncbi:MAG: hypothetical protein R3271_11235 [Methylophaga sp.]|uniref:hypothetical protein n=1 Tax=Methylophaga sp. TaxID=2024840 RepID=UPI00299E0D58|nr:hypothetical protein [Methylophaga sp.]MDX1750882.1 hypothetical protein [Methylophaga sp.]